jgi:hypothetical protein
VRKLVHLLDMLDEPTPKEVRAVTRLSLNGAESGEKSVREMTRLAAL